MQREVASWSRARSGTAPRALILGVTPELAALDWPKLHALLRERCLEIACRTPAYEDGHRYRIIALARPA